MYIGPKSRTVRPRKTKIGTEVGHLTHNSDTTFKVKRSTCMGRGILWWPPAQLVKTGGKMWLLHMTILKQHLEIFQFYLMFICSRVTIDVSLVL